MSTPDEFDNLCANIRFLRQTDALSRRAMANKLGITVKTLDLLEADIFPGRIRFDFFFRVEQAYGITPQQLLYTRLTDEAVLHAEK